MKRFLLVLIILLALGGIGCSYYLAAMPVWKLTDPAFHSICEIDSVWDCGKVSESRYSQIFGVPLAIWGLAFYAVVATLGALAFSSKQKLAPAKELIFGLSVAATLLSCVLFYISKVKIGALCLFCTSLHGINLGLLVTSYFACDGGIRAMMGRLDRELASFYRSPLIYIAGVLYFGLVFLGVGIQSRQLEAAQATTSPVASSQDKPAPSSDQPSTKPSTDPPLVLKQTPPPEAVGTLTGEVQTFPRYGHEASKGTSGAPIQLTLFSDFECPFCARAATILDEVARTFPKEVEETYRHYPLSQDCNPYIPRPMHPFACQASVATQCARRQGQFWELHDMIFRNQQQLSEQNLVEWGRGLGLDMATFVPCLQDRAVYAELNKDIELGHAAGLRGTPSLFINGQLYSGPFTVEGLTALIRQQLANAPKGK